MQSQTLTVGSADERYNEVKRELVLRELARRSLPDFQTYVHPWFKPSNVHKITAFYGDKWLKGEIEYLMCLMPPRNGKTQTNTEDVTAFGIGLYPDWEYMVTSYSKDLATEFGRHIIGTIKSPQYKNLFPDVRLSVESHASSEFALEYPHRGKMVATGRGGAQTGKGWNRGIIDDPTKDWEEAISPRFRSKSWDWVRSTFITRAMADETTLPAMMVNMTHWHEDDIAGRFIKEFGTVEEGGRWTVIRMPAICENPAQFSKRLPGFDPTRLDFEEDEPEIVSRARKLYSYRKDGDALWPERYPLNVPDHPNAINSLENIRFTLGSKIWTALYQQRPTMEEGEEIKSAWFKQRWAKLSDIPSLKMVWGEIDTALKPGESNDRTAWLIAGLGENGLIYLIKGIAGHFTGPEIWDVTEALQEEMDRIFPEKNGVKLFRGQYMEDASSGSTLLQYAAGSDLRIFPQKVRHVSKLLDVRSAGVFCERGHVVPPANEPWWEDVFLPEILAFGPAGSSSGYDDCTDVFARAILRVMGHVKVPGIPEKDIRRSKKSVRPVVSRMTGY